MLVPRATYSRDREDDPKRLTPVNINSKHFYRPKCWATWAAKMSPVGHEHIAPGTPKKDRLSPETRRRVTSKGGKASSCAGIRRGFGGHRDFQEICDAKAFEEGKRIVALMVEKRLVDKDTAGNEALAYAIGVVRGDKIPVGTRLQAAKLVMDFTLAKPAAKSDVRVTVEDFLADLAEEARTQE
jgi:hypothetical protein